MLIVPPIPFLGRRKPESPGAGPPVPPGPPLHVFQVITGDPPEPGKCGWTFDGPATLTETPFGLRILIDGLWLDPISASQGDAVTIYVVYDTENTLDGYPYTIEFHPLGIAEASSIVIPQDGIVAAP